MSSQPARDGETLSDEARAEIERFRGHLTEHVGITQAGCRFCASRDASELSRHRAEVLSESDVAKIRESLAHGNPCKPRIALWLCDTVAALRAAVEAKDRRIAELLAEDPACESCDEYEQLNGRLGDLLARTADALKGEPELDSLHSWHDLPEVAAALRADLADARAAAYRDGWIDAANNGSHGLTRDRMMRESNDRAREYAARAASGEDASHD